MTGIESVIRPTPAPGTTQPWDVTLPGFFLPANWSTAVQLTTNWSTEVLPNQNDGEARRGRIGKPTRAITGQVLASSVEEVGRVQGYLSRTGFSRFLAPLYPDQVRCANDNFPATATFLWINTDDPLSLRRFYNSQYAMIYERRTNSFKVVQIQAIDSGPNNTITFGVQVGFKTYRDTIVVPMIQSRLELDSSASVMTDRVVGAEIKGMELPGPWCLPASQSPNTTPSEFVEYDGKPVFSIPNEYRVGHEIRYTRTGKFSGVGNTQVEAVYGERMRQARKFKLSFSDREQFWSLLKFFDSRAGRVFSWWLPSFTHDYEVTELTANGIKVESIGPIEDWDLRPYISITMEDGTVEVRTIQSVSTDNVIDTLILDSAFDETQISNISRCGFAQLVRFAKDEMVENWQTDSTVDVDVETIEVVQEVVLTLANLTEITTSQLASKFAPENCEPDVDGCDPSCVNCANCKLGPTSTISLAITDAVADLANNGLDSTMALYLTQDGPFEIPFDRYENSYFIYAGTVSQTPGSREIEVDIRYDCLTGVWSWSYVARMPGQTLKTFRACGDCLFSGAPSNITCDTRGNNGRFFEDCWNTHVRYEIENYTDYDLVLNGQGCTGIPGWATAVRSAGFADNGFADNGTAIMFGVRGEWTVSNDDCCDDGTTLCIPCLNSCLIELDCTTGSIPSTTGCFARAIGLPALDGGTSISCNGCDIIVVYTGETASCCRGDGSLCPRIEVRAASPGCLGCGDPDWDPCPRAAGV